MKFGKAVAKHRVLILILSLVLMIPALLGMMATRINYDMLDYLQMCIRDRISFDCHQQEGR